MANGLFTLRRIWVRRIARLNPDRAAGYVWPLYRTFDIFSAKPDGTDLRRLTTTDGYDAEGTVSPDGRKIIFTSTRDNDIELYEMDIDGKNQKRLTNEVGYDGGAFYSQDGQWIVWRASRPKGDAEIRQFRDLLARNLVMPAKLEIMIMKADGTQRRQLTSNGAANFAPYFHPNGTTDHLGVERKRNESRHSQFRSLSDQSRRYRTRTGHVRRKL